MKILKTLNIALALALAPAAGVRAGAPALPVIAATPAASTALPRPSGALFPAHFERSPHWVARAGEWMAGSTQRQIGRMAQALHAGDDDAARWYAKAARHGDADAAFRLGLMYGQGRGGLPRDLAQASRLLHAAAESGHVDAQGTLGLSYLLGQGVRQNLRYAYMWVSLAADARGGASVRTKALVARAMPADALQQALELARRCRDNAYLDCDPEAWR